MNNIVSKLKALIPLRHLFYYVCALGVLATLLVYIFPFRKIIQNTEAVNKANEELRLKVVTWKGYFENQDFYIEETGNMLKEISDIHEEYPADVKEEDVIMLAVNLAQDTDITITNINLQNPNTIYTIPAENVKLMEIETFTDELCWDEKNATYTIEADYETVKESIKTIYNQKNNIGIEGISISKSDEGVIGNIDVSLYSLKGTTKEYKKPDISKYINGTNNIFGMTYEEKNQE